MAQDSRNPNGVAAHIAKPTAVAASAGPQAASAGLQPMALQRRAATVDPLSDAGAKLATELLPGRLAAVSNFYLGVHGIREQVNRVTAALASPTLPDQLIG